MDLEWHKAMSEGDRRRQWGGGADVRVEPLLGVVQAVSQGALLLLDAAKAVTSMKENRVSRELGWVRGEAKTWNKMA